MVRLFVVMLPLFSLLLIPEVADAAAVPKASRVDTRLCYVSYHPDEVYVLRAAVGRALFIQFRTGEEMESFYTGDSEAWEVGRHKNLVALKPTAESPNTNLIISTNTGRVYTFDLKLSRAPMYGIRFSYPLEKLKEKEIEAAKRSLESSLDPRFQKIKNYNYAGAGSVKLEPAEIFDNGSHTFLLFPENMSFPSVFAVGPDGGEQLVNKTVRGNWLILPRVERLWRLRHGEEVLCVRNDAYAPSARDNPGETIKPDILRKPK